MPNISIMRLRELEEKERELEWNKKREACQPFVRQMIKNMGTILGTTPFSQWPKEAKAAFKYAERDIPTGAQIYLELLPQEMTVVPSEKAE